MTKALYILAELNDRDLEWLVTAGRQRSVSAGTELIREGERTDALYILLKGKLEVSVAALEGQQIALLSKGDIVGEMSFIDARPPAATVKALEDCLVWTIPRSQLIAKLMQDVSFSSHFYHAMAMELSDRMRGLIPQLGYAKYQQLTLESSSEEDLNPELKGQLDLLKARFDYLLRRLMDK